MAIALGLGIVVLAGGIAAGLRWLRPNPTGPLTLDGKRLRTGRHLR